MRTFTDEKGRRWDVVTGRESWGAVLAIFIPRLGEEHPDGIGGAEIRQAPLRAAGYGEATAELDRCSQEDLQDLLDRSVPKNTG